MSSPPVPSVPPLPIPRAGMPWRVLAGLAVAVVLLHAAALHLLPAGAADAMPAAAPRPFVTRIVQLPPPPAQPKVEPPPTPPRPAARSIPKTAVAQVRPAPSATTSIADEPAVTAPPTLPTAPAPEPSTEPATEVESAPPPVAEAAPPPAPPLGVPAPTRLQYDVNGFAKGLTWHAKSELVWQQDGARYDARLELSAFLIGSRVQTSRGRIDATGLVPERFSDKARSEQAAHFDYDRHRIVFSANTSEAPLQAGAQDRLGVFLQLGALLAGDPARYPVGTAIPVPTVGTRDAAEWRFMVGAPETLALPVGETLALRLDRAPRKDYDTRVEVWYAPALGYLPVRMRITQYNGDFVDQQLRAVGSP